MITIFKSELYRIWRASDRVVYLNRTGLSNDWYRMQKESDLDDARYAQMNDVAYKLLNK